MKYYRHPTTGEVFAYEADGSQDAFIPADLVPMTEAEVMAHTAPAAPDVAVPAAVSSFQARAALLRAGLLDDVEAIMADAATPREAVLAWEYATEFRRGSPTVAAIAGALDLTDEQLDDLFIEAATIVA